jgi:hypothetical protein
MYQVLEPSCRGLLESLHAGALLPPRTIERL